MKNPKKPTRYQRKFMEDNGYDARAWYVTKDTSEAMTVVYRKNEKITRELRKGGTDET